MAKPAISRIFALRILRISQNLAYNERRQQHCYQKKEFLHFSTLIKVFSLVKWWMCNNNGFFVTFSPLSRRRAPQKLPKKEFELFEFAGGGRVFKLPATSRSTPARGHKLRVSAMGGQVTGVPFLLVRFLSGKQRK